MKLRDLFTFELNEWRWSDLKYPFGRPKEHKLSQREVQAVKNLVLIARERLWLLEHRQDMKSTYSAEFDELMTEEQINKSVESIRVCEGTISTQSQYNQR